MKVTALFPVIEDPLSGVIQVTSGEVVSMIKVMPVEFHARSSTMNTYVPSPVISVPLAYQLPFSVAPERFRS